MNKTNYLLLFMTVELLMYTYNFRLAYQIVWIARHLRTVNTGYRGFHFRSKNSVACVLRT